MTRQGEAFRVRQGEAGGEATDASSIWQHVAASENVAASGKKRKHLKDVAASENWKNMVVSELFLSSCQ